jgi:hypothetical protein
MQGDRGCQAVSIFPKHADASRMSCERVKQGTTARAELVASPGREEGSTGASSSSRSRGRACGGGRRSSEQRRTERKRELWHMRHSREGARAVRWPYRARSNAGSSPRSKKMARTGC